MVHFKRDTITQAPEKTRYLSLFIVSNFEEGFIFHQNKVILNSNWNVICFRRIRLLVSKILLLGQLKRFFRTSCRTKWIIYKTEVREIRLNKCDTSQVAFSLWKGFVIQWSFNFETWTWPYLELDIQTVDRVLAFLSVLGRFCVWRLSSNARCLETVRVGFRICQGSCKGHARLFLV